MARPSGEKTKDFLSCTYCKNIFNDPCTLDCQHTFCRSCVTKHLNSRRYGARAVAAKIISCPSCHKETAVPIPTQPFEGWAGQIQPSLLIKKLMVSALTANITDDGCSAPSDHSPTDHSTPTLGNVCEDHKMDIKLHCRDCSRFICQICSTDQHKDCTSLVPVETMKEEIKSTLQRKRNELSKKIEKNTLKVKKGKAAVRKASQDKQTAKFQIRSASKNLINLIKDKEKSLNERLNMVVGEHVRQLKSDIKIRNTNLQTSRQQCELIDMTLTSSSAVDLYETLQTCESVSSFMEEQSDASASTSRKMAEVKFVDNDAGEDEYYVDKVQLGDIDISYTIESDELNSPQLINTIETSFDSDENPPVPFDLTVLIGENSRTIVVTDYTNRCVKSFSSCNGRHKLAVDSAPFSVTRLSNSQVMVAVPESRQILTLEVGADLSVLSTLTTERVYNYVSVINPSTVAAACSYQDTCVDILSIRGDVIKSVASFQGVKLFSSPSSICVDQSGNVYVTGDRSVVCLNAAGDVLLKAYIDRNTHSMAVTGEGNLLVVDSIDFRSSKIIQLRKESM